ncbi:hypothetical protein [Sulfuracidifex tepidarius]|uniref:hypothetical protein n=1 Tax=Sulfuracidifex tepidarius TaxID=1294262 RepID=UPI0006CF257B|nr:hypothetical protein [Sulfuracidifex tepidarius]
MSLAEILERFKLEEEDVITIENLNPDELKGVEIKLGTNVILQMKGRKRIIDLGLLSIIFNKCDGVNFVKDFLNLNYSLDDIHRRYRVYTELEYFSLNCPPIVVDPDLAEVATKLKAFILSREKS